MSSQRHQQFSCGFSLIELMIVVAIVGVIATIAIPSYREYVERTEDELAIANLTVISGKIDAYRVVHNRLPPSLNTLSVPGDMLTDPWGNAYQYLDLSAPVASSGSGAGGTGSANANSGSNSSGSTGLARKNRNLVPINTDYDLYSMGRDGRSVSPLTANDSRDDIVRANNGAFIGKVEDY